MLTRITTHILDRWLCYTPAALGALTLVGLVLFLGHWGIDDPYITFRYASNLLAGHGLVYNVGERTLSTTAPLYAILLAGLGLLWSDLPAFSNVLSALSLVLGAAFLGGLPQRREQRAAGLIAALLLSLAPYMIATFGAETCFYVMLILGGLWAYERSRLTLVAIALALAAMVRPDGLVAAVALGLYHLARRQPAPWRAIILYASLVGAWYAGLWLYFGSPVPVTLLAKQQQGQMTISTRFGPGFLNLLHDHAREPLYWLPGILIVPGLARVFTRARHWIPLLGWAALYFLAYTLLGVSRYFWYYSPLMPALAVLVAEGAVLIARGLNRARLPQVLIKGLTCLLLVALLAPLVMSVIGIVWQPDHRLEVYREIGQWIEANTPPEASIGTLEVGIIGYYARRTMIDFAGLIQPDLARRFTPVTTYQDAAIWAIQTHQPDYVLLHQGVFSDLIASDWFQAAYQPMRSFTNRNTLWLTLYRRSETP